MQVIRRHIVPDRDGEIFLRDLPVTKDQEIDVIIVTDRFSPEDQQTMAMLQNDPGWAFLWDPAEDVYTLDDIKGR